MGGGVGGRREVGREVGFKVGDVFTSLFFYSTALF